MLRNGNGSTQRTADRSGLYRLHPSHASEPPSSYNVETGLQACLSDVCKTHSRLQMMVNAVCETFHGEKTRLQYEIARREDELSRSEDEVARLLEEIRRNNEYIESLTRLIDMLQTQLQSCMQRPYKHVFHVLKLPQIYKACDQPQPQPRQVSTMSSAAQSPNDFHFGIESPIKPPNDPSEVVHV